MWVKLLKRIIANIIHSFGNSFIKDSRLNPSVNSLFTFFSLSISSSFSELTVLKFKKLNYDGIYSHRPQQYKRYFRQAIYLQPKPSKKTKQANKSTVIRRHAYWAIIYDLANPIVKAGKNKITKLFKDHILLHCHPYSKNEKRNNKTICN